jgi:NAD(P)-dependent dehydrogenase (short-subunit alcohol dehydrogenase family)
MTFDPFEPFRMANHVALITGGAQNIGEAIARTFAAAGAKVMIADLNGEKAEATAQKIAAETGQEVLAVKCDVTDDAQVRVSVAKTVETLGGLTTLVNNVGWGEANPDPMTVTTDQMIASYKLNTISALRMVEAAAPHLRLAKNATITNSGSMVGIAPAFDFLAYSAAKAALNHMMLGLAHALAKQIRVNTVVIGTVLTEGYAAAGLGAKTQERLTHPDNLTGRSGTSQDVANAFLWLASPAGSWVSGQVIQVAGGPKRVRLIPED